MRFDCVTLFPDMFRALREHGITRRAFEEGLAELFTWSLREFTTDNYRRVDSRPYGGGAGMVMLPEPIHRAMEHIRAEQKRAGKEHSPLIYLSARGQPLTQAKINAWVEAAKEGQGLTLLCGRYEGIDQRVIEQWVDEEINVGEFVVSGGELPAMMLMDAVIRRLPGVIDAESIRDESFAVEHEGGVLLEYPHYTRPEVFHNRTVPSVLLSGNHAQIAQWRQEQALRITQKIRGEHKNTDNL